MKHNWTPETMEECRKVHLNMMIDYYYNHVGNFRKTQIYKLIEHYFEIKKDVSKMVQK